MKKILLYLFVGTLAFSSVSCDEFLEEDPKGNLDQNTYFNDEDDVTLALYPIYNKMQVTNAYSRYFPAIDAGTDDYRPTAAGHDYLCDHNFNAETTFGIQGAWIAFWAVINQCNYVINGLDDVDLDETYHSYAMAEAMTMRAFMYFQLVRIYGELPLITWYVGSTTYLYTRTVDRSPVDDIYEQIIIPDLTYAAEYGRDSFSETIGRATKWTARTLLAEAYMHWAGWRLDGTNGTFVQGDQDNWLKARNAAWSVINPAEACPFGLLDTYGDNWDIEYSREALLELGADATAGLSNALGYHKTANGNHFWGSGPNTVPFANDSSVSETARALKISEMTYKGSGTSCYAAPLPDLYHAYEEGDERKWTMLTRYDDGDDIYLSSPNIRKFIDYDCVILGNTGYTDGNGSRNIVLYRYADAMLIFAEADNEVYGPTTEAINQVNLLRQRAGLADLTADKYASQEAFRQAIRQERRVEFAAEYKRKFDLVRWEEAGYTKATEEFDVYWLMTDNMRPATDTSNSTSYMANDMYYTIAHINYFCWVGRENTEVDGTYPADECTTFSQAPYRASLWPICNTEMGLNTHWSQNWGY